MRTFRISIIYICLLCAISFFHAPDCHIESRATCLAPTLQAAKKHNSTWKKSFVPDIWNIRLLALDYNGTISSANYPFSISDSIRALDEINPDTWTHPFYGPATGETRRFAFTATLLNYIYTMNPSVIIMVVSTGKTPFDALFASRAVNEFDAFPELTRAYREGRFVLKEGAGSKIYEVRETAYSNKIPQKNIVAIGDNPETDAGMALELGTYIELFSPEILPPDSQVDTPLTLILQSILFKAVNSETFDMRQAA